MTQYRFRLTGVPPDQAIKYIEIDPNQSIAEIKKDIQREFKLNPILSIQFIFKGKVIPDTLKFAKLAMHPKKDVITVMATQAGGSMKLAKVEKILTLKISQNDLLKYDKAIYKIIDYISKEGNIETERVILEEFSIKISAILNDVNDF